MQVNSSSASYFNTWPSPSVGMKLNSFQRPDDISQQSVSKVLLRQNDIAVSIENAQGQSSAIGHENQNSDSRINTEAKSENVDSSQKKSSSWIREFDELSQVEKQLVIDLEQRDTEVKTHEMAHLSAAGALAKSGPTYDYQKGPDGKKYAVGGEVRIDSSPVPGDPEATVQKMEQVQRAALAPAEPSGQDRRVAAKASATATKARVEMLQERTEEKIEKNKSSTAKNSQEAVNSYVNVSYIPNDNAKVFSIAV